MVSNVNLKQLQAVCLQVNFGLVQQLQVKSKSALIRSDENDWAEKQDLIVAGQGPVGLYQQCLFATVKDENGEPKYKRVQVYETRPERWGSFDSQTNEYGGSSKGKLSLSPYNYRTQVVTVPVHNLRLPLRWTDVQMGQHENGYNHLADVTPADMSSADPISTELQNQLEQKRDQDNTFVLNGGIRHSTYDTRQGGKNDTAWQAFQDDFNQKPENQGTYPVAEQKVNEFSYSYKLVKKIFEHQCLHDYTKPLPSMMVVSRYQDVGNSTPVPGQKRWNLQLPSCIAGKSEDDWREYYNSLVYDPLEVDNQVSNPAEKPKEPSGFDGASSDFTIQIGQLQTQMVDFLKNDEDMKKIVKIKFEQKDADVRRHLRSRGQGVGAGATPNKVVPVVVAQGGNGKKWILHTRDSNSQIDKYAVDDKELQEELKRQQPTADKIDTKKHMRKAVGEEFISGVDQKDEWKQWSPFQNQGLDGLNQKSPNEKKYDDDEKEDFGKDYTSDNNSDTGVDGQQQVVSTGKFLVTDNNAQLYKRLYNDYNDHEFQTVVDKKDGTEKTIEIRQNRYRFLRYRRDVTHKQSKAITGEVEKQEPNREDGFYFQLQFSRKEKQKVHEKVDKFVKFMTRGKYKVDGTIRRNKSDIVTGQKQKKDKNFMQLKEMVEARVLFKILQRSMEAELGLKHGRDFEFDGELEPTKADKLRFRKTSRGLPQSANGPNLFNLDLTRYQRTQYPKFLGQNNLAQFLVGDQNYKPHFFQGSGVSNGFIGARSLQHVLAERDVSGVSDAEQERLQMRYELWQQLLQNRGSTVIQTVTQWPGNYHKWLASHGENRSNYDNTMTEDDLSQLYQVCDNDPTTDAAQQETLGSKDNNKLETLRYDFSWAGRNEDVLRFGWKKQTSPSSLQDTDVRAFEVKTDEGDEHEVAVRLAPVWPNQRMNYMNGDNADVENNIRKAFMQFQQLRRLDSKTNTDLSNFQFTSEKGENQIRQFVSLLPHVYNNNVDTQQGQQVYLPSWEGHIGDKNAKVDQYRWEVLNDLDTSSDDQFRGMSPGFEIEGPNQVQQLKRLQQLQQAGAGAGAGHDDGDRNGQSGTSKPVSSKGLQWWAILLIVVGSLLVLGLLALAIYFLQRPSDSNGKDDEADLENDNLVDEEDGLATYYLQQPSGGNDTDDEAELANDVSVEEDGEFADC